MLWTTKYFPKKISEVIGQENAMAELKQFIENFGREKRKAALLFGPVGCGKSSSVYAIANEYGYEIFEVNASDVRNEETIERIVGNAIKQKSIFFKKKIILIDELDGISGKEDCGGILAITRLIKETNVPIILISNDPWDDRFRELRKISKMIEFVKLSTDSIFNILELICKKEEIKYDRDALKILARRAGGDLRGAINDLQTISAKKNIVKEDVENISDREKKERIEEALLKIFKTTDIKVAISAFNYLDEDFDKLMLWIDENISKEYGAKSLERAYHYLSLADRYIKRITRRQDWRYLYYINAFLSAGIALSKEKRSQNIVSYTPTSRILKIWIANQKYAKRKAIAEKISEMNHCSTKKAMSIFPYIHLIFKMNKERSKDIASFLGLTEDEIRWLNLII